MILGLCIIFCYLGLTGDDCGGTSSDDVQRQQQEKILQEGTSALGMPAIHNFRMKRILKDILELCDQEGLVTYTYLENMNPVIIHGYTAQGGKLTYLGETIGYGIPYATQYTNPMKKENGYREEVPMPQADPDGLFKPGSAEGTWILMRDPVNHKTLPQYIEPRILTFTFKLPPD
jgi:hypothetical protein